MHKSNHGRGLSLALCCIGMLFLGVLYAWSILKIPFIDEFAWPPTQLSFAYTISVCMLCIGNMIAGFLSRRISHRILLLSGGVLCCMGLVITSLLRSHTPLALWISYGLIFGCGVGICYNTLLTIGNALLPQKQGTSSGLLMMSFGISTLVIGKVFFAMMEHPMLGWRRSYRLLGVSILLMMTACALALCKPWPVAGSVDSISRETKQYTPREMLRSPKFWIFYLYGFLAASVGSSVVSFSRDFAMVLNASENAAIALVGVVSVSNGAGRILTGILMDACGDRRTMTCVSLLTLLASLLLLCASVLNALFLAACGYVLTGLSFGACATISSAFVNRQFGSEHFAVNYSFSNSKLLLSSLSASLCAFLLEKTEDYAVPFVLLVFCAAIAAIFNHLLWSRRY